MSETLTIAVEPRDPAKNRGTGTRVSRRLRSQGRIPAIIYGHKQAPQPVSLTHDDVWALVKSQSHLAQLSVNGQPEQVLIRGVQWDHLGKEIIHLDFVRVSSDEAIDTTVRLDYHGEAPGLAEGGVLEIQAHDLAIRCLANAIPSSIRIELSQLHAGDSVHVRDLTLPEGVVPSAEPDQLLVQVIVRGTADDNEETPGGPVEPEVIGRVAPKGEDD